jgi:hypothetical protein
MDPDVPNSGNRLALSATNVGGALNNSLLAAAVVVGLGASCSYNIINMSMCI